MIEANKNNNTSMINDPKEKSEMILKKKKIHEPDRILFKITPSSSLVKKSNDSSFTVSAISLSAANTMKKHKISRNNRVSLIPLSEKNSNIPL